MTKKLELNHNNCLTKFQGNREKANDSKMSHFENKVTTMMRHVSTSFRVYIPNPSLEKRTSSECLHELPT